MDFNQTARDTLTQVRSELVQGKAEISWAVYEPIANLDDYRKWIKKQFGWQAVIKALLLAFVFVALGLNIWGNIGGVIALVAAAAVGIWLMWQNGKERAKAEKILSSNCIFHPVGQKYKNSN